MLRIVIFTILLKLLGLGLGLGSRLGLELGLKCSNIQQDLFLPYPLP
jgi:hypothetical protein